MNRVWRRAIVTSAENARLSQTKTAASHCDRRWKRFVVRIAKADHETVIIVRLAIGNFQQTEVPQAVAPQSMGFVGDAHAAGGERGLNLLQQPVMGDRHPRLGGGWCIRLFHGPPLDVAGTAVQNEIDHIYSLHEQ